MKERKNRGVHKVRYLIATVLLFAAPSIAMQTSNKQQSTDQEKLVELKTDSKVEIAFGETRHLADVHLSYHDGIRLPYRIASALNLGGRSVGSFEHSDRSVRYNNMAAKSIVIILGQKRPTNIYWPKYGYAEDNKIIIGPEALGADVVSMKLNEPNPGERILAFKLFRFSKSFPGWNAGVGTIARIGDRTTLIQFAPHKKFTTVTGTVGRLFAVNFGGHYIEPARMDDPENFADQDADFRLRKMTTGLPLSLGTLMIDAVDVHDSEGKDGVIIPTRPRVEASDTAYEIVVEALKREPRHVSYPQIDIGMDVLSGCSNITFDFPKELIYLSCVPGADANGVQLSPAGGFFLSENLTLADKEKGPEVNLPAL